MSYYIGIDGGGTKTAFLIAGENGWPVRELRKTGCSYQMLGIERVVQLLAGGVKECLEAAGIEAEECAGCCMGIPCYGESPVHDRILEEELRKALPGMKLHLVNDVEVGWAGALHCEPGIHIVAGTGAIAFGKGEDGRTARCGGWNEFFGDEGSCHWIGKETMSLFTKEADGRTPRGALYDLVMKGEGISGEGEFLSRAIEEIIPHRDRVAAFQLYAGQAARAGDRAAREIYERAAGELALLARALRERLYFSGEVPLSYSGGLFQNGELILGPLQERLRGIACRVQPPKGSALEGALLLARRQFSKGENETLEGGFTS